MNLSDYSWHLIAVGLISYFIGGLPFGYWFVRLTAGKDIRTMGSGNIGATNVHRTMGQRAGFLVLALDIIKGLMALWIANAIMHGSAAGLALATVCVMVGHCYPILLKFKGGKAVACFVGAALYIAPWALLATLAFFAATVALSKYISLASILGAAFFPLAYWYLYHPPDVLLRAAIAAGILIIYRHKGNIQRLLAGKENVFSLKGGSAA